ncbi:MAG: type II and III secretion system protein, partial [Elusimicrobia bacterium]|nr:type II and III secretion system protein [Elusimicrobiota bacterium]
TPQGYPQIATRNIDSQIRLKSDWTAVLGGLLKEEDRKIKVGIPFLMDIPLLGYLFRSTKLEKVITEVQIYITPQIVSSEQFTPPSTPLPTEQPAPPDKK